MLTNLDWLRVGEEFPPPSERPRLEKYAQNKKLWEGKHTEVYGDWWRVLREEYGVSHELVFNFHERLSTLWADLVFGDAPVFDAGRTGREEGGDPAQDALDRIVRNSDLAAVGYENVLDVSRCGVGVLKLRLKDGKGILQAQSPATWFPVVALDDQREVLYHVFAWTFEQDDVEYLRAEIHGFDRGKGGDEGPKGYIENRLYELKGGVIQNPVPLERFFPNRAEREVTRLSGWMVFYVPGTRAADEFFGKDDYEKVDSLILERMARAGQLSRIQDRHSDPAMYGDRRLMEENPLTGQAEVRIAGRFVPVDEEGTVPGYIVWDANQDAQFRLMEVLKKDLYEVSETTPTSFGSSETGYAESGTSLRLRMVPPLSKARRIRSRCDPVFREALIRAAELEAAWGIEGAAVPETINATWSDGLPRDPREEAQIESQLKDAGLTSLFSSIRRLRGGTDEEIREEIGRIREDEGAENPSPLRDLFGPSGLPVNGANGGAPP